MKKKLIVLSSVVLGAPFLALAQTGTGCSQIGPGTIEGIVCKIGDILNIIIPILIILAVIYFIWGVVQFVISGDEESKTKGRNHMIYGIIGLVVIVGVWGLVNIVRGTFNIQAGGSSALPTVQY